jgi:MFS transporter, ACS family, hexuronate transporter
VNGDPRAVPSPTAAPPLEGWRWGIVWLMFLATLINYMDRQTLGSTILYVKAELNLTDAGYGQIEFWFLLAYALFQVPAGFLADRLNLRWLYAGALIVWSAAGFLTGWADTVLFLSICRMVLGLAEAFNWPCAVGIVRRLVPLESRGLANGIFHSGASIGAVLTPLLVMFLVGDRPENWRRLFQVVGVLGLAWGVLWFSFVRGQRAEAISQTTDEQTGEDAPGVLALFRLRQFWIALGVGIAVNICWHFYRVWLPRFLDVDLKLSGNQILLVLSGFFLAADVGSIGAGYLTRRLASAGWSVERARKIVLLIAAFLCLLSTPAALAATPAITLPLLFLVAVGAMGGFPIFFALNQETSPRRPALCLGLTGSVALLSIAALNPPIGWLVDQTGTFAPCLMVVGCVPLVGAVIGFAWPEPATCREPAPE